MGNVDLFDAVLALGTREECQNFFSDLLTRKELTTLLNRWQTICLLYEGRLTQREVCKQAKVSLETVSRASNVIKNGTGGVQRTLLRLCNGL